MVANTCTNFAIPTREGHTLVLDHIAEPCAITAAVTSLGGGRIETAFRRIICLTNDSMCRFNRSQENHCHGETDKESMKHGQNHSQLTTCDDQWPCSWRLEQNLELAQIDAHQHKSCILKLLDEVRFYTLVGGFDQGST
jgi:hypothetical protein